MKKRGFTLIELLIVIAIIAILALIAIPNFLEAQTRSKISRVMADMRSMATAIEAYCVDWSRYPIYQNYDLDNNGGTAADGLDDTTFLSNVLTTPIAFITSWSIDPFRGKAAGTQIQYPYIYRYSLDDGATLFDTPPAGTAKDIVNNAAACSQFFAMSWAMINVQPPFVGTNSWTNASETKFSYVLNSPGPDLVSSLQRVPDLASTTGASTATPTPKPYDPTNGTISAGDIMRFGPQGGDR